MKTSSSSHNGPGTPSPPPPGYKINSALLILEYLYTRMKRPRTMFYSLYISLIHSSTLIPNCMFMHLYNCYSNDIVLILSNILGTSD